jgi:mono/diheme cytochrome c family protein
LVAALLAGATLLYGQSAQQQYKQNCKKCHGDDGQGHTMVGKMVKAANLTSDAVAKASDAELTVVIDKGKGKMSGFGVKLGGDAGVANMLSYVRSLKK